MCQISKPANQMSSPLVEGVANSSVLLLLEAFPPLFLQADPDSSPASSLSSLDAYWPAYIPTDFETIQTGTFPAMSKEFTIGIATINELPRRVHPFDL